MMQVSLPYDAGQSVWLVSRDHMGMCHVEQHTVVMYTVKSPKDIQLVVRTPTHIIRYIALSEAFDTEAEAEAARKAQQQTQS